MTAAPAPARRWLPAAVLVGGALLTAVPFASPARADEADAAQIGFADPQREGFADVELATTLSPRGEYRRIVRYRLEPRTFRSNPARYDGFFAALQQAGIEVEGGEGVWAARIVASSAEELARLTDVALASDRTVFTVESESLPGELAATTVRLTEAADCAAICSAEVGPLADELRLPAAYRVGKGATPGDGAWVVDLADARTVKMAAARPFVAVEQTLEFGLAGDVTWTGEFTVALEDARRAGDDFRVLLSPPLGLGELAERRSEAGVVYTVTIRGYGAEGLASAFDRWRGGGASRLEVIAQPGASLLREDYRVVADLEFAHQIEIRLPEAVTTTITLPMGQRFTEGPRLDDEGDEDGADDAAGAAQGEVAEGEESVVGADVAGATATLRGGTAFTARVGGLSFAGLVVCFVAGVNALAGGLIAIVFRRRIAWWLAERSERGGVDTRVDVLAAADQGRPEEEVAAALPAGPSRVRAVTALPVRPSVVRAALARLVREGERGVEAPLAVPVPVPEVVGAPHEGRLPGDRSARTAVLVGSVPARVGGVELDPVASYAWMEVTRPRAPRD